MISPEAVKENLEEWLQNESWKLVYDHAPSDACKDYLAKMFYASETESEEAFDAMDDAERNLGLGDLKYVYHIMNGPERARLAKRIAALESST